MKTYAIEEEINEKYIRLSNKVFRAQNNPDTSLFDSLKLGSDYGCCADLGCCRDEGCCADIGCCGEQKDSGMETKKGID